jgi:anti-anti-sigma factor
MILANRDPAALIVDLTDAAYIDSSGINALIRTRNHLIQRDAQLVVIAASPMIRRRFESRHRDEAVHVLGSTPG